MDKKQEKTVREADQTKKYRFVLIGLLALQIVMLLVLIMVGKDRPASVTQDDGGNKFFPYWLILFIPIIFAQSKKKEALTQIEQKKRYFLMIGLALLVLLGMFFFLLVTWR